MKTMKNVISGVVLAMIASGCSTPHEEPLDELRENHEWHWVIASQGIPADQLQKLGREFQDLISTRAAPDDVINVITAPQHTTVCSIVVPNGIGSVRLRDPAVKKALPMVKSVFAPETVNAEVVPRVRLPDLATAISAGRRTSFAQRVVIVGSPLYRETKNGDNWIMTDGKFPTDGVLGDRNTPFGVAASYPSGTTVSWVIPGGSQWSSHEGSQSQYQEAVNRFNRLLLQTQDADLIRITTDPSMACVFDNPQLTGSVERRDEPPMMLQFQLRKSEVTQLAANFQDVESVLRSATEDSGKIALAIEWTSAAPNCDLDMWTQCVGYPGRMGYSSKKTGFGELFRDVTRSRSGTAGGTDYRTKMEWLQVNHNRLQDLTFWIHVYSSAKPATVRIIRVWKGERKEKTIVVNPSKPWNRVDLMSF